MQVKPPPHKRTLLKHAKPTAKSTENLWTRRFWIALASIAILSVALVTYNSLSADTDEEREVYVTVQTRTMAGNNYNVLCKLSLAVSPDQEQGVQKRRALLESVVSSVLSEAYMGEQRPPLGEIRTQLLEAINKKLPKKLQVHDVLLQELLIGNS